MKIAIDYDDTITLDPETWLDIMKLLARRFHRISVVTFRNRELDWCTGLQELEDAGFDVFCTGGAAKRWWCSHYGPGDIDVWIDDTPESILSNSTYTPAELVEFRKPKIKEIA